MNIILNNKEVMKEAVFRASKKCYIKIFKNIGIDHTYFEQKKFKYDPYPMNEATKLVYNIDEDIIYVYSYDEKKCELHMDNKRLNITKINM
jgi:hypothetical protein